jgi:hypothetical protein
MIVEGLRKADSVSSRISPEQPLCVVGLVGVWGWKRNGKPLPDWNRIVLKDRRVIVCYDSDAGTVREVSQAREALVTFLTSQGANVKQVELPRLPPGSVGPMIFWWPDIASMTYFASLRTTRPPSPRMRFSYKPTPFKKSPLTISGFRAFPAKWQVCSTATQV